MGARILLAGLYHETHTFVREITGLADFDVRRGHELFGRRGDGSTIDGFLEVAAAEDWRVVPAAEYVALPSGTVDHEVLERFRAELEAAVRAALAAPEGLDGIWLSLHGAMVTTRSPDAEGDVLEGLRRIPGAGALPVFGVFDLHAAFTDRMAAAADGLVAYRENPHADARASAVRSARLLARALEEGRRPFMAARRAPVIWPPTGTGTADPPMRDLLALARRIEAEAPETALAVNVVAGYAFADVPEAGVAFSIVAHGARAAAEARLDRLVAAAVELRAAGLPDEHDLDGAIRTARGLCGGPVLIVEPADNIGGGAPGDCTSVLRAFLRHQVADAAVAIADPAAVTALDGAAPGEIRRLSIGGRGSPLDPGPVEVEAELVSRSDGAFTLEDPNSHLAAMQGTRFSMGPSAVVRVGGTLVLLTSRKTPPFDLAQFRSQGIAPEALRLVGIKAAVAHRRAWEPIAAASFTVATPGPCASDPARLPYRRLRRPIFPLDDLAGGGR